MAKYGRQSVPELSFHNPAGMILYPRGLQTYAMEYEGQRRNRTTGDVERTTSRFAAARFWRYKEFFVYFIRAIYTETS